MFCIYTLTVSMYKYSKSNPARKQEHIKIPHHPPLSDKHLIALKRQNFFEGLHIYIIFSLLLLPSVKLSGSRSVKCLRTK